MADDNSGAPAALMTLLDALEQYLLTLKPEQRRSQENYIRRFVRMTGESQPVSYLSGSRVELYAVNELKPSDPNAQDQVAALKAWFQFLKKREFTTQNFGIHIRVKPARNAGGGSSRVRTEEPPVEMTADGIAQLKGELAEHQAQRLQQVRAVEVAREDGDLRENAPYHAAREQLAFTDNRIRVIEETLKRAVVVERDKDDERSVVGCLVTVTRLPAGAVDTFQLVGAREANARDKKISVESPVGRQLLGRTVGELVDVELPNGTVNQYRIDGIQHA